AKPAECRPDGKIPQLPLGVFKIENLVILKCHSITEPRADRGPQPGSPAGVVVATGWKHSTNLITSLKNQLSIGSGRYRSMFCNWVAFESATKRPLFSQLLLPPSQVAPCGRGPLPGCVVE